MVDREILRQAAKYKTNEHGKRVVDIPADLWEEWVSEEQPSAPSQKDNILAALAKWDSSASDLSDE
jgi:hypothetical protein